jgi:SAM-dependent MidA family methyltransferase
MPVQLLQRTQGVWHERGVVSAGGDFAWQDRLTDLRPPVDIESEHDYLTEIHPQAEAFIASLAERLLAGRGGAAFFLDYGFPEGEYFHPQRQMGTVMCHQLHQADDNPLVAVGQKDITAHVNFTGVALAAQNAGLQVLGYASQAWFLLNLGLAERMAEASLAERSASSTSTKWASCSKWSGSPRRPIGPLRALPKATGRIACKRHQGTLCCAGSSWCFWP